MSEHPIKDLMGVSMEKIKEMVDVNTIIGTPIQSPDGTVIIPISKVSFGFASGGSDLPTKNTNELFGGGAGAGVSIQPLAFLVVSNGDVKLLQMSVDAKLPNAIVNLVPEVFDKVQGLLDKGKKEE
ncbi:MAG: GerW family sporulation protein [Oscillospiraceae bacterium]|nr:GerW family sporulation protein [Oscillospiraceae bacterium]MBQ5314687.1 GerW family sporulation protein [Oscillospiraceae bacterium]MBQ7959534.1 GerW family sporulation protein [Oscillospiraceae bacterium]MBR4093059.1 GerW family sporulation protein [Oscillospiraceae bacterium]MBR6695178.1 GerW family sporulation protein [Oscillospiraceae bacterium]